MPEEASPPIDLESRDEGTGPTVLLVHGVGGDHTLWNEVVPRLSERFRVLAPDLRGHGRTPAPAASTFTFAEMMGDLLRLLDRKKVDSAHWVGLSGGAFLGLRVGLDQPARLRSLSMISGAGYADSHMRSIIDRWAQTLAKEGRDAYALRLLKDLYYPDWIEAHLEIADRLRDEVADRDLGPAGRWARSVSAFDERDRIGTLNRPVLLIQGMDDGVVDAAHGRIFRQSVPGAQLRLLPQTGHMVPVERPTETAEAVISFVTSVEAGPRPG